MFLSNKTFLLVALLVCLFIPGMADAHQPRLVDSSLISVLDPEISKAFYAKLDGQPHYYEIDSQKDFDLYVNVLVPDIQGQKKDVSAVIIKNGDVENPMARLDGLSFQWKAFFEPFGYDNYWMGPEYKAHVDAGKYEVRVFSTNNDSKYSLAIGEAELFDFKEIMNALTVIPKLKADFFNESPATFIFSMFGWGLILFLYILAFAFGLIYRQLLRRFAKGKPRGVKKNIAFSGRLLRAAIGLVLLTWAITTTWSLLLIFLSGFCFFEAVFSWCGLNAALGKNSCPIN